MEAEKFYKKVNTSGLQWDVKCVAFMPLFRSNIDEAYYKKRLWLYNVDIVVHKTKIDKEPV